MAFKLFLTVFVALISWTVYKVLTNIPPAPELDFFKNWGPDSMDKNDTSIKEFTIVWSEDMIADLKHRIKNHRKFTPPLDGIAFEYGFNTDYLESILKYWSNKYDFKKRLEFLNQYPQFKTRIQGLDIHFIRVKSESNPSIEVIPLLLLHGWPGSTREFYELLPLLSAPGLAFDIIVPSLPGYGFSDGPSRPGMGPVEIAVLFRSLMHRLGYERYYVQGGDWGSIIAGNIATLFPEEVLGYHTNMPYSTSLKFYIKFILGSFIPGIMEAQFAERMYPLSKWFSNLMLETGYFHLQATKPDTIGVAVSDSPAGLAAYHLEKMSAGAKLTNIHLPDGGLSVFQMDQLLDNLMMYWSSNSVITSFRLYPEGFNEKMRAMDDIPTSVPTWILHTANEPLFTPAPLLRFKYTNLIGYTVLKEGGHFAALEAPKLFAEDVVKAVEAFREFWNNKKDS